MPSYGNFLPANRKFLTLAGVAVLALAFSSPARADFLDDIFGPEPAARPSAPALGYRSRENEGVQRRGARGKVEVRVTPSGGRAKEHAGRAQASAGSKPDASSSAASSRPVVAALCAPEATVAGASASTLLNYDKTLRNGDILVTEAGVQVFRGHAACPHDARDFLALSSTSMSKSRRSVLLAIEEAARHPAGYVQTANLGH
jgi:hypothetical protein